MKYIRRDKYNCHYCLAPCQKNLYSGIREIWKCNPCDTMYTFDNELAISPVEVEFRTKIKDSIYIMNLTVKGAAIYKLCDYIDLEGHYIAPALVERLETRPTNITPQNVAEKIKMYIMFS